MVQIDEKVYGQAKGKLEAIFDAGTFVELGAYTKRSGSDADFEGVLCGYGAVNGKLAFAVLTNYESVNVSWIHVQLISH